MGSCWTIEELDEANPGREGAPTTPFRELLSLGAVCAEIACEIADELDRRTQPHLAAFFQLPYRIDTRESWLAVPLADSGVSGELRLVPCRMTYNRADRFQTVIDAGAASNGYALTQCILIMPYWGLRARYFPKYEKSFREHDLIDRIIVPQVDSWMENRPIRASDFESRLAGRIVREVQAALRVALPAISIVSQRETPLPEKLIGYHVMPKAGRIKQSSDLAPMLDFILARDKQDTTTKLPVLDVIQVQKAISFGLRTFNDFEQQLFAMNSLLEDGELTSAHIGTVGLMEWMLRYFTDQPDTTKVPLAVLLRHPDLDELPSDLMSFLKDQRPVRNDLVHGRPLPRRSLVVAGHHRERGRQMESASRSATVQNVSELIRTAFELYRAANVAKPGFAKAGLS